MPAPKGKGLCIEKECAKILHLAGIKDIWSRTKGQTKVKLNMIAALIDALKKLSEIKIQPDDIVKLGIVEGKLKGTDEEIIEPVDIPKKELTTKPEVKEDSEPIEVAAEVVNEGVVVEESAEKKSEEENSGEVST